MVKCGNRTVSSKSGSADVLEALNIPLDLDPSRAVRQFEPSNFTFLFAPAYNPAIAHVQPVYQIMGIANPAQGQPIVETMRELVLERCSLEDLRGEDGAENAATIRATFAGEGPEAHRSAVGVGAGAMFYLNGSADSIAMASTTPSTCLPTAPCTHGCNNTRRLITVPKPLPTVLEEIVAHRRGDLPGIRRRVAHLDFGALPRSERSLYDNLKREGTSFIMECKSSSPSLGLIRADYKPGEIASVYSRYAAGSSVLCEPLRFGGDYDHLATVASSTHLPVLCKDFIIDEVQVYAARYFGADAILLMLSILDDASYAHLAGIAESLGMDVLTEVISEEEAVRASRLGPRSSA